MKRKHFVLLCAAFAVIASFTGCNKDKDNEPESKQPKYSVSDADDLKAMKTLANQFSTDSASIEGVIKGLGFTHRISSMEGVYAYFRSAAESGESDSYPFISLVINSNQRVNRVTYASYTSSNVVPTKSQILNQLGDTIVVMGRNYPFEQGYVDKGDFTSSLKTLLQQCASAYVVVAEWSQIIMEKRSSYNYINIEIGYNSKNDLTYINYTCNLSYLL